MERNFTLSFDYFRERDKSVDELLSEHLLDDVLVVVVPEGTGEFVIIHVGLVLPETP